MKTLVFRLFASFVVLAFLTQALPAQATPILTQVPSAFQPGIQPDDEVITNTQATIQTFDCANISDVPPAECEALVALYNSTDGDHWTDQTKWLTGTTVADWYGIDVWEGHVSGIFLENNNLAGTLPSGLDALTGLVSLVLTNNQLTGSIPPEFGNLPLLYWLFLSTNQLTGIIPPELGNLSKLGELQLQHNQLTGPIPTQLGGLTNLEYLYLSTNQLSGEIPSALGNLEKLKAMYLGSNELTGEIPAALGNLAKLTQLVFSNNHLSGSIPPELGNLTVLNVLWIEQNPLTGSIPMSFIGLVNLESFSASYTYVCEPPEAEFQTWRETVDNWWGSGLTCQPAGMVNLYLPCVMR